MRIQIALILSGLSILSGFGCRTTKTLTNLSFENYPIYEGDDLGLSYTSTQSTFKIWAPTAEQARIRFYTEGQGGSPIREPELEKGPQGTWELTLPGDLAGTFYTFQVRINKNWSAEVVDPYAKAVGINGKRALVIDLDSTDPPGWELDQHPKLAQPTDAVIYELHVRDISSHPNSGIRQKGTFLGLAETGSKTVDGLSTGLDHLKELGITHVHLLPSFDFRSIDETNVSADKFNWGYDPLNYNVPEGSYASDPYDGAARIREFKTMVQTFHDNGIGVILDVVYNHTGATENSNFNQLVPGYYYRQNAQGGFSDASACGNETASERPMVRKFIVESVLHWIREYHIDGFRFDLMGIHDVSTMNAVRQAAEAEVPGILLYGEGWTAGNSPLPESQRAVKANTFRMPGVAAFSDELRDGIKGHVFTPEAKGFVSGNSELIPSVQFGLTGAIWHPQVDYSNVNYSDTAWAAYPGQMIAYASCHDNHTLWDKLQLANPQATEEQRIQMHKLALTIVLTAQGVPFLHAGTELLRSKQGVENSFESPDSINQIDWSRKAQYQQVYEYIRQLVFLRRAHPAFRMNDAGLVRQNLTFLPATGNGLIALRIDGTATNDSWPQIVVIFNSTAQRQSVGIPYSTWVQVADGREVNSNGIRQFTRRTILVDAYSAAILYSNSTPAVR